MIKNKLDKTQTYVISGFPGIGKTYFHNNTNLIVLDSDSSQFSWINKYYHGSDILTKERNPNFPNNYITHIKENIDKVDIILVSSHKEVRNALVENSIYFTLVYPLKDLKENYLHRFKNRGSGENFISMLDRNWDSFIDDCVNQDQCFHFVLDMDQYLDDVINKIIIDYRKKNDKN